MKKLFSGTLILIIAAVLVLGIGTSAFAANGYTIENEVIFDNEYCTVSIIEADTDNVWGLTFKLYVENKSGKDLVLRFGNSVINGYAAGAPVWTTEFDVFYGLNLSSEEKSCVSMTFDTDFTQYGINSCDEIRLTLAVFDLYEYETALKTDEAEYSPAEPVFVDSCVLYPTGLTADEIIIPERVQAENEAEIVSSDDLHFVVCEAGFDDCGNYELQCYIENKTDENLSLYGSNVTVNGYSVSDFWIGEIPAKSRSYAGIRLPAYNFEENEIGEVESMAFTIELLTPESYYSFVPFYKISAQYNP